MPVHVGPKIKSDESVPRSESFMERNLLQRTLGDYERQTPPSRVRRQTFQAQRTWKEDGTCMCNFIYCYSILKVVAC